MSAGGIDLPAFFSAMLSAGMVAAVPLLLAALGDAVAQKSGSLNLGIEGMMLAGAFFGFLAADATGSAVAGIAGGVAAGLALGLLFGVLAIGLRADQVLVGLGITIVSGGLTGFLYRDAFAGQNPSLGVAIPAVPIPFLRDIPVVGPALFGRQLPFYFAFALVPAFAFLLARTRFGLEVRAAGERPLAADAAGADVARVRWAAIAVGGGMAGFAGAFLSVADLRLFQPGMTVGSGFVALALVMVGGWNPWRILAACVLFGMLRALGNGLQILGIDIRPEFVTMLPYVGVMVALVLLARRTSLPAALGVPYERGRR